MVLTLVLVVIGILFVALGVMPFILSSIISREDETTSPRQENWR